MRDRNAPLKDADVAELAFGKMGGLLPAIVQDRGSGRVLMLGYMDEAALGKSLETGLVTFFSRSKNRHWQKGETSGNRLHVHSIFADCDDDALIVLASAEGPTCHTGAVSCFGADPEFGAGWLEELSSIIRQRAVAGDVASYTSRLLAQGAGRVAQKVGEEGVEVALAAVSRGRNDCVEELADLHYHAAVLMECLGISWEDVIGKLKARHSHPSSTTAAS